MSEPVKKFTLNVTRFQMEILEEALINYLDDADTDDDWFAPATDLIDQVKEDDEPWISVPNASSPVM